MPLIRDRDELLGHMARAIAERERYIFVTDRYDGHCALASLAWILCERAGDESDLHYGVVDWFNVPTQHRCTLSFLTVPKTRISPAELEKWLKAVGAPDTPLGDNDLIAIAAEGEAIITFLSAMEKRRVVGEG